MPIYRFSKEHSVQIAVVFSEEVRKGDRETAQALF
jgi:hypothetical protein